jgi:hypothetical protein
MGIPAPLQAQEEKADARGTGGEEKDQFHGRPASPLPGRQFRPAGVKTALNRYSPAWMAMSRAARAASSGAQVKVAPNSCSHARSAPPAAVATMAMRGLIARERSARLQFP